MKLLDPSRVNFVPLQTNISHLTDEVSAQKRRVEYQADDGSKWKDRAEKTLDDMNDLKEDVAHEINVVNTIIGEVQSLSLTMESGTGPKVASALKEAQAILDRIKEVTFIERRDKATDQVNQANILVSEMTEYGLPVKNLMDASMNVSDRVENFSERTDDLQKIIFVVEDLVNDAAALNNENTKAAETANFDTVKNATGEANEDLREGEKLNQNTGKLLDEARSNVANLSKYHKVFRNKNSRVPGVFNILEYHFQEIMLFLEQQAMRHRD